jgi:hypothetical protein
MRYAEELRQLQQAGHFGALHQHHSHGLEKNDLLLSEMVIQGLNNLAQMAFQTNGKLATQPAPARATARKFGAS